MPAADSCDSPIDQALLTHPGATVLFLFLEVKEF